MTASDICSDRPAPKARGWGAVVAVAGGIFTLVTAEMLPVGILLPVADDLGVSIGTAGLMVTAPGVVAAVAALGVTIAAGRLDRRLVLAGLMALLVAASLACALAPSFSTLLAARIAVGLSIGGFWAIASGVAVRLVAPEDLARASATIFAGVAAASVLGVPLGTTIGGWLGWRAAFGAVGLLALAIFAALAVKLPRLPAETPVRPSAFARLLADPAPRMALIATALIVIGHFGAYTFVAPTLERNGGLDPSLIATLLLAYGVAGVCGNFIAGAAVAQRLKPTLAAIVVSLGFVLLLTPTIGATPISATALLVAWGLAYGGVSVSLQTWIARAAPAALEPANAAWAAVFNGSIALGAFLGGTLVDASGVEAALWAGGAAVLAAAIPLARARV